MAENEEVLEELYELLSMYFDIGRVKSGIVSCHNVSVIVEPQLDEVILREELIFRINDNVRNYYTRYNE